jgi:hypothetical protein
MESMRPVYKDYAENHPSCIVRQTKRLNTIVLNCIVPKIIDGIECEIKYLKTINNPIEPLPLPINVGNRGRKTLPSTMPWNIS